MNLTSFLAKNVNGVLRLLGVEMIRSNRPSGLQRSLSALQQCGLHTFRCIDVGAHVGSWSRTVLTVWPQAELLLVEPQSELLQQAQEELGRSERLHYRAVGCGPVTEFRAFHHHERKDSSSFLPVEPQRIMNDELVPVVRIDDLISEVFGGECPEILKLDCEGWDLDVLKGAGNYLGRIPVIFVEVGVTNTGFPNTVSAALDQLGALDYLLFDVGDGARNSNGALWNAELCFVSASHPVWTAASTWSGA